MEDYNDDTNTKLKTPIKIKENFTRIRKISSAKNIFDSSQKREISPCVMKRFETETNEPNIENFDELIKAIETDPVERDPYSIKLIKDLFQKENILQNLQKKKTYDYTSSDFLNDLFANNLQIHYLQKNETLFRLQDIGDLFYVILKGQISVFLPDKQKRILTRKEYFDFLNEHLYNKDIALLKMTLGANMSNISFENFDDFIEYNKVKEMEKLFDEINSIREDVFELHNFYTENKEKLRKFGICKEFSEINFLGGDELKEIIEEKFQEYFKEINNHNQFKKKKIVYSTFEEDFNAQKKKKEFEIFEKEKFLYENESKIMYDYRKKILKKFELSEIQKIIKNEYGQMEDDVAKIEYLIYNYQEKPSLGPLNYFGDLALNSLRKQRTATIKAKSNCILGYIKLEVYRDHIYRNNQEILKSESLYLHGNNLFNSISMSNFRNIYFKYFQIETFSRNDELTNSQEESSKIYFLKSGTIDISVYCSYKEINDNLKTLILQGYKEGIYGPEEFKKLLENYIINVNEKNLSQEEKTKLTERRNFDIVTLNGGEIIGLESLLYDILSPFTSTIKSENAKIFSIEKSDFLNIIHSNQISRQNYFNYSLTKINTLIERLNNFKMIGYMNIKEQTGVVYTYNLDKFFNDSINEHKKLRKNKKFKYLEKYQNEHNTKKFENSYFEKKGPELTYTNEVDYNENKLSRMVNKTNAKKSDGKKVEFKNSEEEKDENNPVKIRGKRFSTTNKIVSVKDKDNLLKNLDKFVRVMRKKTSPNLPEIKDDNNYEENKKLNFGKINLTEENFNSRKNDIEEQSEDDNSFNSESDDDDKRINNQLTTNKNNNKPLNTECDNHNNEKLRSFYMNKKNEEIDKKKLFVNRKLNDKIKIIDNEENFFNKEKKIDKSKSTTGISYIEYNEKFKNSDLSSIYPMNEKELDQYIKISSNRKKISKIKINNSNFELNKINLEVKTHSKEKIFSDKSKNGNCVTFEEFQKFLKKTDSDKSDIPVIKAELDGNKFIKLPSNEQRDNQNRINNKRFKSTKNLDAGLVGINSPSRLRNYKYGTTKNITSSVNIPKCFKTTNI